MPAEIFKPEIVNKPWGNEVIFAHEPGAYVGKLITVDPKQSLSCQFHHYKHETIHVVSGALVIALGYSPEELEDHYLYPGTSVRIPPGVIHTISAQAEGCVFAEASTAHHNWQNDVSRLGDRYGREGTTAP